MTDHPSEPPPATTSTPDDPGQQAKAVLFGVVGVALMVGALGWAISTRGFLARAATAHGEVIALRAGGAHPEVRFTTATGQVIEYGQNGMISDYHVGDPVEVLYDPAEPRLAPVVRSTGAIWGFNVALFLMGALFALSAYGSRRGLVSFR